MALRSLYGAVAAIMDQGVTLFHHIGKYLAAGYDGPARALRFARAVRRATQIGAPSLSGALDMIAHEYLQATQQWADDHGAETFTEVSEVPFP